jgi:hypothetical protein
MISNLSPRELALMGAATVVYHALRAAWPSIKICAASVSRAWPWVAGNGGVVGVLKTLFVGKQTRPLAPGEIESSKTS